MNAGYDSEDGYGDEFVDLSNMQDEFKLEDKSKEDKPSLFGNPLSSAQTSKPKKSVYDKYNFDEDGYGE